MPYTGEDRGGEYSAAPAGAGAAVEYEPAEHDRFGTAPERLPWYKRAPVLFSLAAAAALVALLGAGVLAFKLSTTNRGPSGTTTKRHPGEPTVHHRAGVAATAGNRHRDRTRLQHRRVHDRTATATDHRHDHPATSDHRDHLADHDLPDHHRYVPADTDHDDPTGDHQAAYIDFPGADDAHLRSVTTTCQAQVQLASRMGRHAGSAELGFGLADKLGQQPVSQ